MKGKRRLPLVLALLLLFTLLPARATGTDRANTLAAGGQAHSLAVQEDGTVLVWGDNSAGQLGLGGDVAEIRKPTAVEGVSAVSVAAGEDFSAALRYDGAVYTWGHGVHAAPVQAAIDQVAAIAAISDTAGLDSLPENLRQLARLRLDEPELTLRELGARLGISRSGVNHRLQRLLELGEKIMEEKGIHNLM